MGLESPLIPSLPVVLQESQAASGPILTMVGQRKVLTPLLKEYISLPNAALWNSILLANGFRQTLSSLVRSLSSSS